MFTFFLSIIEIGITRSPPTPTYLSPSSAVIEYHGGGDLHAIQGYLAHDSEASGRAFSLCHPLAGGSNTTEHYTGEEQARAEFAFTRSPHDIIHLPTLLHRELSFKHVHLRGHTHTIAPLQRTQSTLPLGQQSDNHS